MHGRVEHHYNILFRYSEHLAEPFRNRLVAAVRHDGGDVLGCEVERVLEVVGLAAGNLVEGGAAGRDDGLGEDVEGDEEVRGGSVVLARGGSGGEARAAEGCVGADVADRELVLVDRQAGALRERDDVVQERRNVGQDLDATVGGATGIAVAVGQHGAGHVGVGELGKAVGLLGRSVGVLPDKGLGVEHAGVVGAKECGEREQVVRVLAAVEQSGDTEGVERVREELARDGGSGKIGRDDGRAASSDDLIGVESGALGDGGHDDRVGRKTEGDLKRVGVVHEELLGVQAVLLVGAGRKVLVALGGGVGGCVGGKLGNDLDRLKSLVHTDRDRSAGEGGGKLRVDAGVAVGAVVASTLVRDLGGEEAELTVRLGDGAGLLNERSKRGNEGRHVETDLYRSDNRKIQWSL